MAGRILLIGANGQVAWELQRSLGTLGEVVTAHRNSATLPLDLAAPETIASLVDKARPDLIVNAAAYTAVDKAESEADLAVRINADAVGELGTAAARHDAPVIHYSTDYVFDGSAQTPYTEHVPAFPQTVYGESKLKGEQLLAASGTPHLIFRTSWVYGSRGHNFLLTMRRLAHQRPELRVVADQFGAPTWSRHIAEATGQIVAQLGVDRSAWTDAAGIYHLSAEGQCSWFEFASYIVDQLRGRGSAVAENVLPITTADYPTPATRPAFSVLDSRKLQDAFGVRVPHWQVGADLVLNELPPYSPSGC